ncbi:helix-turn-helix transcriptional regulator [Psychroserpens sp.]|uniref:helix-turn-helix transcriptional regulator n=1 Tax=Psychroserpens sp. TaxID=2020870 RepID=UPI002B26B550|nr:helix-turn-helix transcriptional regulator [Psychroserpens sp.]
MKQSYTNSLATVRADAEVSLEHLALMLRLNQTTLREMESGKQRPSLRVVAVYHLLFKAPYAILFADLCADVHADFTERSKNIITELKSTEPLKSKRMIQAISNLVNRLNTGYDD